MVNGAPVFQAIQASVASQHLDVGSTNVLRQVAGCFFKDASSQQEVQPGAPLAKQDFVQDLMQGLIVNHKPRFSGWHNAGGCAPDQVCATRHNACRRDQPGALDQGRATLWALFFHQFSVTHYTPQAGTLVTLHDAHVGRDILEAHNAEVRQARHVRRGSLK